MLRTTEKIVDLLSGWSKAFAVVLPQIRTQDEENCEKLSDKTGLNWEPKVQVQPIGESDASIDVGYRTNFTNKEIAASVADELNFQVPREDEDFYFRTDDTRVTLRMRSVDQDNAYVSQENFQHILNGLNRDALINTVPTVVADEVNPMHG